MYGEINEPVPNEEARGAEFPGGAEELLAGARLDQLEALLAAQIATARRLLAAYREVQEQGGWAPYADRTEAPPGDNVVSIYRRAGRRSQWRPRAGDPGA